MKPILIATDYSPAALHAADYAAKLAKVMGTSLVVFHAWMIPVYGGETLGVPFPVSELEQAQEEALKAEIDRIEKKWGIKCKGIQTIGFATAEIENYFESIAAGLLVLGMKESKFLNKILGSVATAFLKRDVFPMLIVPEGASLKLPGRILLATDLHTKSGWHEVDYLKGLASHLNAGIHIMNAMPESKEHVITREKFSGMYLENLMKDYPHTWHYESDGEIVHSIFKIADETNADWVVAIPHRMNWLARLFNRSITKDLAFSIQIPLLVLPERHVEL